MRKLNLKLDDLQVESFDTEGTGAPRGTVHALQAYCCYCCCCCCCCTCGASCGGSCYGQYTCDGYPSCIHTCNDDPTCKAHNSCQGGSCYSDCATCPGYISCDWSCQDTCQYYSCYYTDCYEYCGGGGSGQQIICEQQPAY
ncbi:MAG TPA: hypothetical protein VFQ45_06915 [Longimicrobium sp.]|nr:hypothetical protein [Longimicrobium sp.]